MTDAVLLLPIVVPAVAGLMVLAMRRPTAPLREALTLFVTLANLIFAARMFGREWVLNLPWAGFGLDFNLRLFHLSGFVLLAAAGFALLVALYSWKFMRGREHLNQYYGYLLITLALTNGAVLADHLVLLLFFWEGLLLTLFGMIAIGRPGAWKTATKALIIVGITDLCLMLGIILTGYLAGTLSISAIAAQPLSLAGLGAVTMILLTIGAISKAGSMPFHSWIPDAAVDAPLPFMAFLPASLEKLLGIYFLARITLDLFALTRDSWISTLLMVVGCVTILLAVSMALIQKDYKRLLSYHAISQVGYMILGIGTCLPIGIVGGLFHMINHAMYKSCLFLTGGAVEKQTGTTDLAALGGLGRKMPVTFICFIIAAASISGVPPFNGFFSKELVYDGALQRGLGFYLAALLGSLLTAASFLKLGHAAFCGPREARHDSVREAPVAMLAPMIIIAAMCVLFGLWNWLPIHNLIDPILGPRLVGHTHTGLIPSSWGLVAATLAVLALALANHLFGVRRSGSGLGAADHIHHAPVLATIYDRAERRWFDPYDLGVALVGFLARGLWLIDRGIDWLHDVLVVRLAYGLSGGLRFVHTGNYSLYVLWAVVGAAAAIFFMTRGH